MSVELFWPAYEPFNETKTLFRYFFVQKVSVSLESCVSRLYLFKGPSNVKVRFPFPRRIASCGVSAQKGCSVIKKFIQSEVDIVSVEFSVESCCQCFGSITIAIVHLICDDLY